MYAMPVYTETINHTCHPTYVHALAHACFDGLMVTTLAGTYLLEQSGRCVPFMHVHKAYNLQHATHPAATHYTAQIP